jgi:hypothetical protein
MFGKLFGKSETKKPESKNPALDALVATIQQQKAADPFIGAKLAGKEVLARLINGLKDERGVHSESLCCALGALAGYACQASVRAQSIAKGLPPDAGLTIASGKDGRKYYFGDPLNKLVAEDRYSVWSLAAGAAQAAGATQFPDLEGIFRHVAATVGGEGFGQPRYVDKNTAGDLPINYLVTIWPAFLPIVKKLTGDPALWHMAYGFAIQEAITMMKGVVPPERALGIIMESAIPMSKVDLAA